MEERREEWKKGRMEERKKEREWKKGRKEKEDKCIVCTI